MSFSERQGLVTHKLVQIDQIDNDLANGLWNSLSNNVWDQYSKDRRPYTVGGSNMASIINPIWEVFFKLPTDEMQSYWEQCLSELKERFYSLDWNRKLDFLELVVVLIKVEVKQKLIDNCNFHFERENSAYRFVDKVITQISNESEIEAVEQAVQIEGGTSTHFKTALSHYSSRDNPDYRNSIKESISAVESLCKRIANDDNATLGGALGQIERNHDLNPVLKSAFSKLYGYTSSADGIRHGLMEEDILSKADAKFMLVACSAFANYLIEKFPNNNE